ncbi:MAG TPA: hypothetical protein VLA80_01305, partial [Actinomycetota bacterium]|nr:hypothetical protein [Actinomycetota bacterium]
MDEHEADPVLVAAQPLHDPVDAVAGQAEHRIDAPLNQPFGQALADDLRHGSLLQTASPGGRR